MYRLIGIGLRWQNVIFVEYLTWYISQTKYLNTLLRSNICMPLFN